ncbi:MAG: ATP-binding cassette domain-containing protein [Candidatus Bathyarchaeia archaeon]
MDWAVQVKSLVKIYDGKVRALDNVDLSVEAGKAFALLGPNGAGKTTLIRILTTQIKPTSGEAYVFGLDVVHEGSKVRRLISYVPQEMSVWTDISGYENLLIYAKIFGVPNSERKKVIDEVLENMGLTSVKDELVSTYSGGMIRRLEIACAMLIKPKIMFLDEPTIGLDPAARKVVWERLSVLKKEYGVTIFFNTHYMDEADLYADDIAIINLGKIVARGTSEELKHSLGGEVISFSLVDALPKLGLKEKIRKNDFVKDVLVENSNINVLVENAEIALPHVMGLIKNEGVNVGKVSITKPTLDDVFLKYAGTRLEDKGRISDVTHMRYMIRKG